MHCREEICSTCLSKESVPFVKSKSPLSTSSLRFLRAAAPSTSSALCLHHAHPFIAAGEKNLSHAEKQRVCSWSCGLPRTCWEIFPSPMVPCDHCKTLNHFGDWPFNQGGLEVGLPVFQLPMSANCDCRWNEESCFTCLFGLRNLNLHSLPVAWCSWELVSYGLPPPVHHGDSFAAKELLSPLLSPRIIFAHRIQSTAGRISPLIQRFDCCAAVHCDSALIRWRSIAVVHSKIQDFQEFGSGIYLFVKVPDSWPRIKNHLQAEGNESSRPMRTCCAQKPV